MMSKKKKNKDKYNQYFIYAWGTAFSIGSFFAIYINFSEQHSKIILLIGAVVMMIVVSLFPIFILLEGIKNEFFRYGSPTTYVVLIKKKDNPIRYRIHILLEILSIITVYVVGIYLIIRFLT
jgi:hypothetical protein